MYHCSFVVARFALFLKIFHVKGSSAFKHWLGVGCTRPRNWFDFTAAWFIFSACKCFFCEESDLLKLFVGVIWLQWTEYLLFGWLCWSWLLLAKWYEIEGKAGSGFVDLLSSQIVSSWRDFLHLVGFPFVSCLHLVLMHNPFLALFGGN